MRIITVDIEKNDIIPNIILLYHLFLSVAKSPS